MKVFNNIPTITEADYKAIPVKEQKFDRINFKQLDGKIFIGNIDTGLLDEVKKYPEETPARLREKDGLKSSPIINDNH